MSFSDQLKQIRKQSLLSQEAFSKELGVSFATVNRWEKGKSKPNYKGMKMIDEFCKNHQIEFDITKALGE